MGLIEYENEFMGHYSKGNSGFGIYSNLEVKNYINETKGIFRRNRK